MRPHFYDHRLDAVAAIIATEPQQAAQRNAFIEVTAMQTHFNDFDSGGTTAHLGSMP